jgi:hypothetical protein
MLESDQNQIINRDVAKADLPLGLFVGIHRSSRFLLDEPLNGSGDVLRKL